MEAPDVHRDIAKWLRCRLVAIEATVHGPQRRARFDEARELAQQLHRAANKPSKHRNGPWTR